MIEVKSDYFVIHDGDPIENGLYVAYINSDIPGLPFADKKLLMFVDRTWSYPGSAEKFRAHIYGYIGPIPAMRLEDPE